jgi:3-hydroxyacyl-[acyl-carrier-protein] dehydratase
MPKRFSVSLTAEDISRVLPHRYPFLLVDRILEIEPGKRVVGRKCVTHGEPFFRGHFPGRAIKPGVLVLETIAQVGAVLMLSGTQAAGVFPCLTGIRRARFRCPVVPGDVMTVTVTVTRLRGHAGWARGEARVAGKLVCDMAFSFCLAPANG